MSRNVKKILEKKKLFTNKNKNKSYKFLIISILIRSHSYFHWLISIHKIKIEKF